MEKNDSVEKADKKVVLSDPRLARVKNEEINVVEKAGAKINSVKMKVTNTPVDKNISGTTDYSNRKSNSKTSILARSSTSEEFRKTQFVSFKTPSSLPKVIERKRKLFDKIRAKQHHGNNISGGEEKGVGDESLGVSTTSGDTSKVCQDQHEKVKSRDAGQQSPTVLKRLSTAKLVTDPRVTTPTP